MKSSEVSSTAPIIIYQMGKVGSTSIYHALRHSQRPVYQVHELREKRLRDNIKSLQATGLAIPKHYQDSLDILAKGYLSGDQDVLIITPIRPLLERNRSAFIQQLPHLILKDARYGDLVGTSFVSRFKKNTSFLPTELRLQLLRRMTIKRLTQRTADLQDFFIHHYPHHLAMKWVEDHFQSLKIDPYAFPFDATKGQAILRRDHLQALILDSTLQNHRKVDILEQYLGASGLELSSKLSTSKSIYAPLARALQKQRIQDSPLIEQLRYCRYSQHFYSGRI